MQQTGYHTYTIAEVTLEIPEHILNERMRDTLAAGDYEHAEAKALGHLLTNDEIVLEIGAGVGLISSLAARNPKVRETHAVEANPELIPVIKRTHALNGVRAKVYHEMLGPEDGTHPFFLSPRFWASSTVGKPGDREIQVPMASFQRRLDAIQPSVLITDIEGGELTLFRGVSMPSVRNIMIEVHPKIIGHSGVNLVLKELNEKGFRIKKTYGDVFILTKRTILPRFRCRIRSLYIMFIFRLYHL